MCGSADGVGGSSGEAVFEWAANICFIRVLIELSWCSARTCIFNSAIWVRVEVPIRFRSFVSVFPNTLKSRSHVTGGKGQYTQWVHCEFIVGPETIRPAHTQCHRAIFHAHFSTVFTTLSLIHSFTSFTFPLLSLFSTLLSRYRLAIRLMTLTNYYDLMTVPFILFLFFIHTLSFDEMRTW